MASFGKEARQFPMSPEGDSPLVSNFMVTIPGIAVYESDMHLLYLD